MRPFAFIRDRSGATAVELALVLWPLAILMFGSIEVARVLWVQQALNTTAISAARCVGIRNSLCASNGAYSRGLAVAYVRSEARSFGVELADSEVAITDAALCAGAPGFSQVTLTKPFSSPVPFIAAMMTGMGNTVSARACFPTQAAS